MLSEVLVGLDRGEEALPHLEEAAQLFAQLEDREAEAVMRRHAADAMERSGRPDAVAAWDRVRVLAREAGDPQAELVAAEGMARAARTIEGATEATTRAFEDTLALATRLGDARREAALRNTLGILLWERGRFGDALAHYEAALRLVRAAGDRVHEGLALNSIGVTLARLSRYEEARTALDEALAVNRHSGERRLEAHSLAALGDIAQATSRLDAALACYDASSAIRREIGDRRGEGWMLHHLARTHELMGDAVASRALYDAAARIAADCGDAALGRASESGHLKTIGAGPAHEE
jgi:tetratricopeptide (TPR) repeat protein